jgi:type VI protein secretion system component VasF
MKESIKYQEREAGKYARLSWVVVILMIAVLLIVFFWYERRMQNIEAELTKKNLTLRGGDLIAKRDFTG